MMLAAAIRNDWRLHDAVISAQHHVYVADCKTGALKPFWAWNIGWNNVSAESPAGASFFVTHG